MDQIDAIINAVLKRLYGNEARGNPAKGIPVEMSARHVHLSAEDMEALFGTAEMPKAKDISQPGQYLSTLRVKLLGPKGMLDNVAVLGPVRGATQVEISATDARALGFTAPVRLSGALDDAAPVFVQANDRIIERAAAIIAKRHLHMTPEDARLYGLSDGASVTVRVEGTRPLLLEDVVARVTSQAKLALHIDTDEANAAGAAKNCVCRIVGACGLNVTADQSDVPAAQCAPAKDVGFEGKLITEDAVRAMIRSGRHSLTLRKGQLITPLARDTAKRSGMILEEAQ